MNEIKATELGEKPIGKLLLHYAIPAIIAMTASSLYNMVDSIFIGQGVGPLAISGLAITFPLMNLGAAFGALVGVGGSTYMAMKLGAKDYATAQRILGNVVMMNIIMGIALTVVCLAFIDPILYFFGASEATLPYAKDYMTIILYGNVVTHLYLGLNALLRSIGHPRKAMVATVLTVLLNTVLDYLFIYPLGLGIKGAAYATVLAQVLALIWVAYLFTDKKEVLHFRRGIYRLSKPIVYNVLSIGMSPFSMNIASAMIVILINRGLQMYSGDLAVGAYGIVNRIAFLFLMIVLGLNQGMQPIAGYNFGAKLYDRVNAVMVRTISLATICTTAGFLIAMLAPEWVVSIFTTDKELSDHAVTGLRLIMMAFPLVGFQMVTSTFFQCIGKAKIAVLLSLSRQVLILIPCLIILPLYWGATGIWISAPIADVLAFILAAILLYRQFKAFREEGNKAVEV